MELILSIAMFLIGFIYLLLPKKICYKLIEKDVRTREKLDDLRSLGIRRHRIEVVNPNAAYIISKVSAFILTVFGCVFTILILFY